MVNFNMYIKQTGVLKKEKTFRVDMKFGNLLSSISFFGLAFGKDVDLLKFVLHVTTCFVRIFSLRVASINSCS